MSKPTKRRALKAVPRTPMAESRPWDPTIDRLPDLTYAEHGVSVPGPRRCHAIGLENGDCRFERVMGSWYCYYHDKLQVGLCSPSVPSPEESDQRDGMALYPVWPLPRCGYLLLDDSPRRLPLAG